MLVQMLLNVHYILALQILKMPFNIILQFLKKRR